MDVSHHFANYDYDKDSGTYHAQFRQYSPTAGRWMSPDPYSGSYDPTNPQSFNRYAYVLNNPLTFTDPSGLVMCNCPPAPSGNGGIIEDIATLGIAPLVDELENIFGGLRSHGSLKPRR